MARLPRMFAASIAAPAMLVLGLALFLFTVELSLPLDMFRAQLSSVVARALGVEAGIDGPIRLITGPNAGIEVSGARIKGSTPNDGWWAEFGRVRVRIAVLELFSKEIHVEEVAMEGARLCASFAARAPDNPPSPGPPARQDWRLTKVERLNAERIVLAVAASCSRSQPALEIDSLHGSAPVDGAPVITAQGRFRGEEWRVEARPPSLTLLNEGSSPAPFELSAVIAGARLHASGMAMPSPPSVDADVTLDSDQLLTLIRLFDPAFKDFGPLAARARIQVKENRLAARVHEARLIPGTAAGEFAIDWSHERPRVSMQVRTGALDAAALHEWLLKSVDEENIGRDQAPLIVALPRETEGNLTFDAERVSAGTVALDAVNIAGGWSGGIARLSVAGRLGEAPVRGSLKADVRSDELILAAAVDAESVLLETDVGVKGVLGHISADVEARGQLGQPLRDSVRASVFASNARFGPDQSGAKPVLLLRSASAHWEAGDRLRAVFAGTAWGEQLDARIEGSDASRLLRREPWRMTASGTLGPLRVSATGDAALGPDRPWLRLDVSAGAERLGSLAAGNAILASKPLQARGKVDLGGHDWKVDLAMLSIDGNRGHANARGGLPFSSRPMRVGAGFDVLDLSEVGWLSGLGDGPERKLLPSRLALLDADLRLSAERVALPGAAEGSLKATGRTRGGRLVRAPFALEVDGAHLKGTLAADLRAATARVSAKLDARGLDERHLPAAFADSGLRGQVGRATLTATSRGNRLGELAANARLDLKLSDTRLVTEARGEHPARATVLSEASLQTAPKQPTMIKTSGHIAGHLLAFEASTAALVPLLTAGDTPFGFAGRFAGLELSGRGRLPIGAAQHGGSLDLRVAADRLDALNSLLNVELPPVGPVALNAAWRDSGETEFAGDFDLTVGESRIHAKAARRLVGDRPTFEVDLTSPLLRLEDLGSRYWVATREATPIQNARLDRALESSREARSRAEHAEWRRELRRFDAQVRVSVDRVTSAGEDLGSGEVKATLQSGRLEVMPFRLAAQGATLEAKLKADLASELPRYWLEATLEGFPYGALLKSMDPMSQHDGHVGLNLRLTGAGELDSLLPRLEGEADLVILPRGSRADILDPWGASLVRSLVSKMDGAKESRLNCAVAAFEIGQGHARTAALMLDSTRVRAAGEIEIDLSDLGVKGWVTPEPKGAGLPLAWLPVRIGGTLEQPRIAAPTGTVAVTMIRVANVLQTFLSTLFAIEPMPADGSEECLATYRGLQEIEHEGRNDGRVPSNPGHPQISG